MSGDREPAVRLTPPPRAPGGPPRRRAGADRRRLWVLGLTAVGLLALALAAASVFFFLPGWVEDRAADRGAMPAEDAAQPAPPIPSRAESPPPPAGPAKPAGGERAAARGAAGDAETVAEAAPSRPAAALPPPADARPPAPAGPPPFDRAVGEGLAALATGDPSTAAAAFRRALELEPGSPPAVEGLARAEEALRSERIAAHRRAALEHAGGERWAQALGEHEAALALDPTLEFARAGAERARRRAALDQRLEWHLERPERLTSPAVRAEVEELLAVAAGEDGGPRLAGQTARLRELLRRAETPVEVVLESDELTEVTVFRVGDLGRFRRRTLELLPGTYVVVGRRSGYRDVRHELVVGTAGAPARLAVRCEEKI